LLLSAWRASKIVIAAVDIGGADQNALAGEIAALPICPDA
jgi:hypothetical protein